MQQVLREEIVNPLRKNQFVRADKVMKLRKFLDHLTSVKGLMSEEKGEIILAGILISPNRLFSILWFILWKWFEYQLKKYDSISFLVFFSFFALLRKCKK